MKTNKPLSICKKVFNELIDSEEFRNFIFEKYPTLSEKRFDAYKEAPMSFKKEELEAHLGCELYILED